MGGIKFSKSEKRLQERIKKFEAAAHGKGGSVHVTRPGSNKK